MYFLAYRQKGLYWEGGEVEEEEAHNRGQGLLVAVYGIRPKSIQKHQRLMFS